MIVEAAAKKAGNLNNGLKGHANSLVNGNLNGHVNGKLSGCIEYEENVSLPKLNKRLLTQKVAS